LNDKALSEAVAEAKRFLMRADELKACTNPQTPAERAAHEANVFGGTRQPHGWIGCIESAAVRRASMDLTRALAKLRRS